jgi:hypothetical protein
VLELKKISLIDFLLLDEVLQVRNQLLTLGDWCDLERLGWEGLAVSLGRRFIELICDVSW